MELNNDGELDLSLKYSSIRIVAAFVVYFVAILVFGLISSNVSTPDILTLLPNQIPQTIAIVSVLASLILIFNASLSMYGLDIDKRWFGDLIAGALIGVIFQGISTVALIYVGDGTIVERWTTGVFDDYTTVALAVVSTSIAYMIVAVGEDLMFRGILIRELTEGMVSLDISRRGSTVGAIVGSSVLFGLLHLSAGAEGLSTSVVVLQAMVAGIYFGIAYTLTNSLAIPIGIHFSTNLWTTVVFGQPDDGYPGSFILERSVELEPDILITLIVPALILVGLTAVWVRVTRDGSLDISLSEEVRDQEVEEE